jgi:hypothetical protein
MTTAEKDIKSKLGLIRLAELLIAPYKLGVIKTSAVIRGA